jgi:hypothetical protein
VRALINALSERADNPDLKFLFHCDQWLDEDDNFDDVFDAAEIVYICDERAPIPV